MKLQKMSHFNKLTDSDSITKYWKIMYNTLLSTFFAYSFITTLQEFGDIISMGTVKG